MAITPDIINGMARTVEGNGCQYLANSPTNGEIAQKLRAIIDEVPTAWALKLVG